ncbi:hypothetical protein NW767_015590 [Fusarium falciforme]|nr:hypothetical protein NW767_015590 [Fusarium falciforme]
MTATTRLTRYVSNENASFPYCATGIKPLEDGDGDELSIYLCGKTGQQVPFYENTGAGVEPDKPTPVGAIVGGVVGGVALIAILGLAFWFLRRKKQSKEVATTPAAPAPAPTPGFPPQQRMGNQGVPPPVVYDYNNNNYAGYPVQGSPPPPSDPRYSQMPVGGMVPPPQSPPIEHYKPVVPPVSELPVTSSPHDNTPVSELPADMGNAGHTSPR